MKFTNTENLLLQKSDKVDAPWIAILGSPNCGKTALFNRLTGLHHKVGNYPGITVEKKSGRIRGTDLFLHDLPGAYSLDARSIDERIVMETVNSWRDPKKRPRAVLLVLDATNLSRSLYLALQVLEQGLPTILVLNMIDEARSRGIVCDVEAWRDKLGACDVIQASAKTGEGVDRILLRLQDIEPVAAPPKALLNLTPRVSEALTPLTRFIANSGKSRLHPLAQAVKILSQVESLRRFEGDINPAQRRELATLIEDARRQLQSANMQPEQIEASARYAFIDELLREETPARGIEHKSWSEKIDVVLLHPVWGALLMLGILAFIFNAIFTWAQIPMDWIISLVAWSSEGLRAALPQGPLNSLLTDGVISGVGNVIVFLPQIALLIFFLGLLEDSGYMSRMAFLLDRGLRRFGLQGKAVLPMLSGFACAIPAVMAARTIDNRRDRLITIMLIPLMSCSARLPVYTLLIAAFGPRTTLLGFLQLQSLVLLAAYFLGFFTAILASSIIKKLSAKKQRSHFIMELPPYRLPLPRSLFFKVYDGARLFLVNAGSIILAISIVLWFLAYYPRVDENTAMSGRQQIEQSYAGQLGRAIEPVIKPLGFDWKIGVGLLTSFAAREVIVSSFATIYNLENDSEESISLIEALKNDRQPDGSPTYPPIVGVALLVVFVFAAQCMSTFAIIKRETNSWLWPMVMLVYMNILAYGAALLVFQGGSLLGWG